jgi:hypothetical protein
LIRVVDQLTKITNSLEQMAAASSKQSAYQAQADKYKEDYQKRQEAPRAEQDSKDTKTGFLKSLGDKIFGLSAPGTLKSNEQQRFTNIAKCFNAVMHVDAISKSIDRLRESNEEAVEQRKRESLFARLTPKTAKPEENKEKRGSILGSIAKWGLLAAALKLLWDLATAPLSALSGLFEFLSKWSIVGLIKLIKFKIMTFFNAITYPLKALYKLITGSSIDNAIKKLMGTVGEWISKIGSNISDAFKSLGEKIPKMLSNAQKYLVEKFPKLASNLSSIGSVMSESFDKVINWVKTPFEKLSTTIVEFFSKKGGGEIAKVAATKLEGSFLKKLFLGPLKAIGKLGIKGLKAVPGIGALISFYFAYNRYKQGDHTGALIEVASGLASSIPWAGTAISIALDMINAWRDMSGKTAEEVKQNGSSNNWFTKMVDGFGKWASDNLYNWPYVGSIVRSAEHFEAGRWKEGFISMANAIPLVGSVLALFDIKETESQAGRGTGNFGEALKSAGMWVYNSIRDIPIIGNVIKAFEQFFSGNFSAGLSELGLGSIIDGIKNVKIDVPSFGDVGTYLINAANWIRSSLRDVPVIGGLVKAFEQFASGNFVAGLSELGLGSIINAIKDFKFEMPSFGDVGDMMTKALEFLRDTILDLPIIRNIVKSVQYAASGQWSNAALELLPTGVVSWFKKLTGDKAAPEAKDITPKADASKEKNQIKIDQSLAAKNVPQTKSFEQSFSNNKIAPQTQKLEFAGISELQQSLIEMSKQEINLLTEQRNLIKDTNAVLWMIYNNSTTTIPNDMMSQQASQYSPDTSTGSPTSVTRSAFNQGKNVMNMGMRQGTLG